MKEKTPAKKPRTRPKLTGIIHRANEDGGYGDLPVATSASTHAALLIAWLHVRIAAEDEGAYKGDIIDTASDSNPVFSTGLISPKQAKTLCQDKETMKEAYEAATGDRRAAQVFTDKVHKELEAAKKFEAELPYNQITNKLI